MEILTVPTTLKEIREKEEQDEVFFEDMVKCVADLGRNLLAVSAELHQITQRGNPHLFRWRDERP